MHQSSALSICNHFTYSFLVARFTSFLSCIKKKKKKRLISGMSYLYFLFLLNRTELFININFTQKWLRMVMLVDNCPLKL